MTKDSAKLPLLSRFLRGEDLNRTSLLAQVKALSQKPETAELTYSELADKEQRAVQQLIEVMIKDSSRSLVNFSKAIESAQDVPQAKEIILRESRSFLVAILNLSNGSEDTTRFLLKILFFNVLKKNAALAPHREELSNMLLGTTLFTRDTTAAAAAGLED